MKSKKIILFLAVGSILLVLTNACGHLSQAWIDKKLLTIMTPDDPRFEKINDDAHQNYDFTIDDALVVTAQGIIIFLTIRTKKD
jgi:hypothetical protein